MLEDDAPIISSLFSNAEDAGTASNFGSELDLSELSADEPLDIFALGDAPAKAAKAASDWQMLVADSGRVYYWNKETNMTSWQRPADFVSVDEAGRLRGDSDIGRLLDKTVEDTSEVLWNNADGMLDSYKTVQMDEDGYPKLDRSLSPPFPPPFSFPITSPQTKQVRAHKEPRLGWTPQRGLVLVVCRPTSTLNPQP